MDAPKEKITVANNKKLIDPMEDEKKLWSRHVIFITE
jgi:hypothetical protein